MKHSITKIAAIVSALLLFFSLLPIWPSGYHILLRYVVGIPAVVLVARAEERKTRNWIIVWIAVAILFNPIVPLRLPLYLHQGLSLICGVLFLASIPHFRL
ncbi:MAG: DUF6804 family protein [Pyrinomonadaceae bacterium]